MNVKEKMLNKINTNPCEVARVLENMNRYGKVYVIVENGFFITGYRKTMKGAKTFAEKSLIQWYDDYTLEMTHNYNEVIEITVEELTDYANDVNAWYEFFLNNPEITNHYSTKGFFEAVYVDCFNVSEEVKKYIDEQYENLLKGEALKDQKSNETEEEVSNENTTVVSNETTEEVSNETKEEEVTNEKFTNENVTIIFNEEQHGIEIYYEQKPDSETISSLKENGWRWHRAKKCWYHKDTEQARSFIAPLMADGDKKFEEVLPGKYTIRRRDVATGSSIINQITVVEAKLEQYAQYKKALRLTYINKDERKKRAVRFVSDSIEFFSGWNKNPNSVEDLELVKIFTNGYEGFM